MTSLHLPSTITHFYTSTITCNRRLSHSRELRTTSLNMPPRRRAAAASGQPTLSFGNKSRVTKPATTPSTVHKAKNLDAPASLLSEKSASGTPEPQHVLASEPSKPHVAELVVREQATAEINEPLSAEDQRALKLSKQDIQRYWKQEEKSRKTPRSELNWRRHLCGSMADD